MKRQTFLTLAAVVAAIFSVFMFIAPDKTIEGMGVQTNDLTNVILQVVSALLLSTAVITFLARKDEGSIALRAIFVGSILMHIISIPIDWIAYYQGIFTKISGFIPGTIIHVLLAVGFIYYYLKLGKK